MITASPITASPITASGIAARGVETGSSAGAAAMPWLFNFNAKMTALPTALQRMNATYTRNSVKNVVQDGVLVQLAANQFGTSYDPVTGLYGYVPEPAATNIATYSDGNASTYTVSNVADGTAVPGFTNGLAFGNNSVQRSATKAISVTSGTAYSISFFVIMGDGSSPDVGTTTTSGSFCLVFDNNIATATSLVTHIGSGVYRVSTSGTASTTGNRSFGIIKYTGQSARTFRCTGIQVETGLRATSYIATAGATATRAADVLSVPLWVNNMLYSENLSQAQWIKTRSSVAASAVVAPSGRTAMKLVEDSTASNTHAVSQVISVVSSSTLTASVELKAGERTAAQVRVSNAGDTQFFAVNINLSTGAYTTASFGSPSGTVAAVEQLPDGWWRVKVTATTNTSFNCTIYSQAVLGTNSYSGDGTSGVYVGGSQVEYGSTATAYRPTTSTLESAANANIPGFSSAGYTLFADGRADTAFTGVNVLCTVSDGTANNYARIGQNLTSKAVGIVVSGGVPQAAPVIAGRGTGRVKLSMSAAANAILLASDGAAGTADTSASMAASTTLLHIGGNNAGSEPFNGFLFRAGLVPQALTQAQINGLTA